MKTPRDILLARHRGAEPKLDAIRQQAFATLSARQPADRGPRSAAPGFLQSLTALARQLRWHLAGMSAVWIIAGWLGTLDRASLHLEQQASGGASASVQLIAALRENRRQVNELLNAPAAETKATDVPAVLPPGRRTGLLEPWPATAAMV
jgi:hypothetical protein